MLRSRSVNSFGGLAYQLNRLKDQSIHGTIHLVFGYRLPKIKKKEATVVIACNVVISSAFFAQIKRNYLMSITFSIAIPLMSIIVYPIAGIVADTCVGRFKVIQTSVALLIGSSLLNVLLALLQDYLPSTAVATFVLLNEGICGTGGGCYIACILPFIGDQLIGTSGEQRPQLCYMGTRMEGMLNNNSSHTGGCS